MHDTKRLSFGLKTTPVRSTYDEILAVWREADTIPEIEHAWLWDHMIPMFGDPAAPVLEGWTLLAALAGRTERLRLGLLVASNASHRPAVLGKMAATLDVISGGRLVFGIGVGGTRIAGDTIVPREYDAYGLPIPSPAEGRARLDETCTIVKRMWTEASFDHDGRHLRLKGTICEPKPVQTPRPPILIGAWGERSLRVVAEHADIWNLPGPPHNSPDLIRQRGEVLNAHCAAIGRDPGEITWSAQIVLAYDDPAATRDQVLACVEAGVTHVILAPLMPYPAGVARWVTDEIIAPVLATAAPAARA